MLAKKPLTQRGIDSLKSTGQRYMVYDALVPGFAVRVTENGYKSFVLVHRFPGSPNPTARAIGTVGKVSLEWARAKAREWHQAIAEGADPKINRAETFAAIANEYLAREGSKLRTADRRKVTLERLIFPALGTRPIAEKTEIIRLLDKIEDERGPEAAHKAFSLMGKICNWYAGRSDHFRSPIVRGMGRTENNRRQRVLDDNELRQVWAACEGSTFGAFVRFLLLTATRRNEAAGLRRSELVGADWIIPPERYKTGLELVIPLSGSARALLGAMPNLGEVVFANDGRTPIGGFSKFKDRLDKASGVTGWTLHDCRRTARSLLSRAGVEVDVAERCLGHVIGGVRGVYDRHSYHREKALAFEALASLIDGIVNPKANVVVLGASR